MKLYVVDCGPYTPISRDHIYALIAETGELLAEHVCSDISWARGDLEGRRPERQKAWRARFGDYEVLRLGEDGMTVDELLRRNRERTDASLAEGGGNDV